MFQPVSCGPFSCCCYALLYHCRLSLRSRVTGDNLLLVAHTSSYVCVLRLIRLLKLLIHHEQGLSVLISCLPVSPLSTTSKPIHYLPQASLFTVYRKQAYPLYTTSKPIDTHLHKFACEDCLLFHVEITRHRVRPVVVCRRQSPWLHVIQSLLCRVAECSAVLASQHTQAFLAHSCPLRSTQYASVQVMSSIESAV